jgi:hypothetical protein
MAPVLNSISPLSGPPGAALVCLGSGFDPAAQVGCPALVTTTFVSPAEVHAAIPVSLEGAAGSSCIVNVFVSNPDGSASVALPFTVLFPYPAAQLQAWTTVGKVCGEVPGFKRNAELPDDTIEEWIRGIAQEIAGAMMHRGLSLNPADWQQPNANTGWPTPSAVLENLNSHGAAVHLASWVAARFSAGGNDWSLTKVLERTYLRELKALEDGAYDKLFRPGAVTVETGVQVSGGDILTDRGDADQAFSKDQVF